MSAAGATILPGATLGVLGGGQLGRMWAQAAQAMGYATAVLDPDAHSPAGAISQHHICAAYDDVQALERLTRQCAALTVEFENLPASALEWLEQRLPLSPGAQAVAVAQDRLLEKAHFLRCGVACAPHQAIDSVENCASPQAAALLPGILKTARLGYDGKGQVEVATARELAGAWEQLGRVPCVLEQKLALAYECSIIVARAGDGSMVHLPPQRNTHRGGILAVTEVFADSVLPKQAKQALEALEAARAIAGSLDYVGVLCVEFFILQDGSVVANEMAPRPHNSGHWSMDACDVSQFALQVRCMAGLPLVPPRQTGPACMLNLLGDLWPSAHGQPDWRPLLALPGCHLHLYGKREARPGRKMGHLNITGLDAEAVRATARQAARLLNLPQ